MQKSESINELAAALAKAQLEMKNPTLDTVNPYFKSKYASLANVRDTVTPVLAKHGLSVLQLLGKAEGGVSCETVLIHASGQWLSETLYMPSQKQDAQGYGSACTYARRYALMAICGVVGDEDDDANASIKTKITPLAGAHEGVNDAQKKKVEDLYSSVIDAFEAGWDSDRIMQMIDDAGLDNDEKVYLASLPYTKEQKAALKKSANERRAKEKSTAGAA